MATADFSSHKQIHVDSVGEDGMQAGKAALNDYYPGREVPRIPIYLVGPDKDLPTASGTECDQY